MDINTLDLKERYTEIKDIVIRHIRGDKKNVALVLSSGGARGLAHIGAIEELIERGYVRYGPSGSLQGVDGNHRSQKDFQSDRLFSKL